MKRYTKCNNVTGLAGKTDLEQARADMLVDCMEDTYKPIYGIFEADETKKVKRCG